MWSRRSYSGRSRSGLFLTLFSSSSRQDDSRAQNLRNSIGLGASRCGPTSKDSPLQRRASSVSQFAPVSWRLNGLNWWWASSDSSRLLTETGRWCRELLGGVTHRSAPRRSLLLTQPGDALISRLL